MVSSQEKNEWGLSPVIMDDGPNDIREFLQGKEIKGRGLKK